MMFRRGSVKPSQYDNVLKELNKTFLFNRTLIDFIAAVGIGGNLVHSEDIFIVNTARGAGFPRLGSCAVDCAASRARTFNRGIPALASALWWI
jgi:hypothetical protein